MERSIFLLIQRNAAQQRVAVVGRIGGVNQCLGPQIIRPLQSRLSANYEQPQLQLPNRNQSAGRMAAAIAYVLQDKKVRWLDRRVDPASTACRPPPSPR